MNKKWENPKVINLGVEETADNIKCEYCGKNLTSAWGERDCPNSPDGSGKHKPKSGICDPSY